MSLSSSPKPHSSFNQIPLTCSGHSRAVSALDYSPIVPDGIFLVSGCVDGLPMLRNGESGDWIGTFHGHKGAVWGAKIDSSATHVATCGADYTARVWDALTGDEMTSFEHSGMVKDVAFSPAGDRIVTGGQKKVLRVFDWSAEKEIVVISPPVESNSSGENFVSFDGGARKEFGIIRNVLWIEENIVISGGGDSFVRIWDIRDPKSPVRELDVKARQITSMEFSKVHSTLALSTSGREVQVWDYRSLSLRHSHSVSFDVNAVSMHPKKRILAVGGHDSLVHLLDSESGDEFDSIKGHFGPVLCIRFDPNGDHFASGSDDGTIKIWQTMPSTHSTPMGLAPPSALSPPLHSQLHVDAPVFIPSYRRS